MSTFAPLANPSPALTWTPAVRNPLNQSALSPFPPLSTKCLFQTEWPLQNATLIACYFLSSSLLRIFQWLPTGFSTHTELLAMALHVSGPLYLCSFTVPGLPLLSHLLQTHDTPLSSCLFHAYSYPRHLHRPFILLGSPSLSPFLPTNYGSNSSYKSLLQDCASREVSPDVLTQSDPYIRAHDSGPLSLQHVTQLPAESQFLGGYWMRSAFPPLDSAPHEERNQSRFTCIPIRQGPGRFVHVRALYSTNFLSLIL